MGPSDQLSLRRKHIYIIIASKWGKSGGGGVGMEWGRAGKKSQENMRIKLFVFRWWEALQAAICMMIYLTAYVAQLLPFRQTRGADDTGQKNIINNHKA